MQRHELESLATVQVKGKWELNLTKLSENGRNERLKGNHQKKKKKDFFFCFQFIIEV